MRAYSPLILTLVLFSCNEPKYFEELSVLLEEHDKTITNYSYVTIINLDACSSCMDVVGDFIEKSADKPGLLVVLVSSSLKKINATTGYTSRKWVIADSEMASIYKYDLINLQPVVYTIDGNNILKQDILLFDLSKDKLF